MGKRETRFFSLNFWTLTFTVVGILFMIVALTVVAAVPVAQAVAGSDGVPFQSAKAYWLFRLAGRRPDIVDPGYDQRNMRRCEQEGVHSLFKRRPTRGERVSWRRQWALATATGRMLARVGGAGSSIT